MTNRLRNVDEMRAPGAKHETEGEKHTSVFKFSSIELLSFVVHCSALCTFSTTCSQKFGRDQFNYGHQKSLTDCETYPSWPASRERKECRVYTVNKLSTPAVTACNISLYTYVCQS